MAITRRDLLTSAAALAASGLAPGPTAAMTAPSRLHARPGRARLAPSQYPETRIWGYDGLLPGPVIRVRQGERVRREFVNELPQASTVHWHGVRLANAMDGVPDLTQPPTAPGETFLYDFVAPDAGTYWYHPHNRAWEQMARGLYGALIVEEREPPAVDRDEVLLIDDWRLTAEAQIDESFGAMGDWSHAGRLGNWATVNGDHAYRREVGAFERLRLRFVNTANARILSLALDGLDGWAVALDGQPLPSPQPLGRILLGPAQRLDAIVDVVAPEGATAAVRADGRSGDVAIATFDVAGATRGGRFPAPSPLAANPVPRLGDVANARTAVLNMSGGAMGGMRQARMGGKMMGVRDLVEHGRIWAFNGQVDMPTEPLLEAQRGETVRISIENDTGWPHAMHLHGHHFCRVDPAGAFGPLRDTLLMDRNERAEIAFVADNPGSWLFHCHMLEHAAAGMITWLRVA